VTLDVGLGLPVSLAVEVVLEVGVPLSLPVSLAESLMVALTLTLGVTLGVGLGVSVSLAVDVVLIVGVTLGVALTLPVPLAVGVVLGATRVSSSTLEYMLFTPRAPIAFKLMYMTSPVASGWGVNTKASRVKLRPPTWNASWVNTRPQDAVWHPGRGSVMVSLQALLGQVSSGVPEGVGSRTSSHENGEFCCGAGASATATTVMGLPSKVPSALPEASLTVRVTANRRENVRVWVAARVRPSSRATNTPGGMSRVHWVAVWSVVAVSTKVNSRCSGPRSSSSYAGLKSSRVGVREPGT
jgi:hypothetical protein